jgi:hypothetical protein
MIQMNGVSDYVCLAEATLVLCVQQAVRADRSGGDCSGGSNPGLGARGLEPLVDFCGREKGLEPLGWGSSF